MIHFYNQRKRKPVFWLGIFFLFTALGELTGLLLDILQEDDTMNVAFYDLFFIPASYLMQFALFYAVIQGKNAKQIILILSVIYLLSLAIDNTVISYKEKELSLFSYCVGSVSCMLIALLYLFSLIDSKAILHFRSDLFFWIAAGMLFFQLFTFPYFALMGVWGKYLDIGMAYSQFTAVCIYVSYLFYTLGIVWMKKR
jgi:hypothetical protein